MLNRKLLQNEHTLSTLERRVINLMQKDIPLSREPFGPLAKRLGITQDVLIDIVESLLKRGVITRFGPLFDIAKKRGAISLCALKVPQAEIARVTKLVNQYQQVAHNYIREHSWNMWFVLACKSQLELNKVFTEIVNFSGCDGMNLPKKKEYFLELYLEA